MLGHGGARLGVHEGPATRRQNARPSLQQTGDDLPLPVPEKSLAVLLEDIADLLSARGRLDLVVGIDEAQFEPLGQAPADRRLATAHHPDQDDRTRTEPPHQLAVTRTGTVETCGICEIRIASRRSYFLFAAAWRCARHE